MESAHRILFLEAKIAGLILTTSSLPYVQKNWLVAGVNAHDAKTQRENMQASTDRIDLMGICKMILSCRGNCAPAQSGDYLNLRTLVRQRRKMVNMTTGVKNRIPGQPLFSGEFLLVIFPFNLL